MKTTILITSLFISVFSISQSIEITEQQTSGIQTAIPSNFLTTGDIDNDGDEDILEMPIFETNVSVYLNDGTANFTLSSQVLPVSENWTSISLQDVDNDGDLDIFYVDGTNSFYANDGAGNFYLDNNLFSTLNYTLFHYFEDMDEDSDKDLITIIGNDVILNTRDASNSFSQSNLLSINSIYTIERMQIFDYDQDGDKDLFFSCTDGNWAVPGTLGKTLVYENDGNNTFVSLTHNFLNVFNGSYYFNDLNNDGYMDIYIHGEEVVLASEEPQSFSSAFYTGSSDGTFTEQIDPFSYIWSAQYNFADIDHDGDIDLFTGPGESEFVYFGCLVYINNGSGEFSFINNAITDYTSANVLLTNIDSDDHTEAIFYGYDETVYDFKIYDLENSSTYPPLAGQVFAQPVSSLDSCNGFAYASPIGGLPPFTFDWFTQTNNDNSNTLDSLCEGFHTLKIYDALGDSAFVDYYVTDSANWYDWYNINSSYIDTIYMADENCDINLDASLDSGHISNFYYLNSGTEPNEDYYYLELSYFQNGAAYTFGDTVLIEQNGMYLIDFSVYCLNRSSSQIKTMLFSLDYPSVLSINDLSSESVNLKLYPNPSNNDVNLHLGQQNLNSNISITDISGKIVYLINNVNDFNVTIPTQSLTNGIYFVNIEHQGQREIIKFIKQ